MVTAGAGSLSFWRPVQAVARASAARHVVRAIRAAMERYGVDVVEMTDVGHFLMMEDPDRFNPVLRGAIDRLGR